MCDWGKDLEMRGLSWRMQMGPKSSDEGPCERRAEGGLGQTDRRHRDGAWVAVQSQTGGRRRPAGDSGGCQSRAGPRAPLLGPLQGARPCTHLASGLPASAREYASVILSCPVCSNLFKQLGAQGGQAVCGVFSKTQHIRFFAEMVSEWEMLAPSSSPHSGSFGVSWWLRW